MAVFDSAEMDATACYKLLIGSVLPRAIGWTSTVSLGTQAMGLVTGKHLVQEGSER